MISAAILIGCLLWLNLRKEKDETWTQSIITILSSVGPFIAGGVLGSLAFPGFKNFSRWLFRCCCFRRGVRRDSIANAEEAQDNLEEARRARREVEVSVARVSGQESVTAQASERTLPSGRRYEYTFLTPTDQHFVTSLIAVPSFPATVRCFFISSYYSTFSLSFLLPIYSYLQHCSTLYPNTVVQ